ncbi:Hypothetical_protein [Hexamita inflata]|uniref:Hypothetical_protein n=1 Tax=Hexamita inflata TaxID=28002 RepID=A0ABP1GFQ7_9EUKA
MIIEPQLFVNVSVPLLQSLQYSFTGLNTFETLQTNEVLNRIDQLDELQSQEFWTTLTHIYNCETKYLKQQCYLLKTKSTESNNKNQQNSTSSEETNNSNKKQRIIYKMTTDNLQLKKNLIKNALIQAVNKYNKNQINSSISDQDLCIIVNKTVSNDLTQKFWNLVASYVPSQSKKQIYDFYHTSFSKALFDGKVSSKDRDFIIQLNSQYPMEKPAMLAEMFLEKTGKHILKHVVIMYFVNLRKSASKY